MLDPFKAGFGASELRPEGTVVLLLMGAVDRDWAAEAAVELSADWANGGRRIVLADLNLENPLLHAGLDVSNLEGVVDIFLYGASLSRIAQPVRGGAFYFIPAGTYAPDVGEIYRHPRWRKLVAGFRDTGATLILFAPAENADLEALAKWTKETIILGPPPGQELTLELERVGIRVLAVLEPPVVTGTEGIGAIPAIPYETPSAGTEAASRRAPGQEERVAGAATAASGAERAVAPTAAGARTDERPPVTVHRPPESELELPPPPVRRRQERRATSLLLWILLAVVVLTSAAYLLLSFRPDLLPGNEPGPAEGTPAAAGLLSAAPAPTRRGELLPYSVQVKAFTSFSAALEEVAAAQRRIPAAPFIISPEEVQGILYYKILAGLSTDTLAVTGLRDRLVELELVDEEDAVGAWSLIQFTPLAFDLGEFPSPGAALERADSLEVVEIPAYSTLVPYSDGSERWQLYGGAYRDSASAEGLRERLLAAGIEPRLTARTGLPATLPE